MPRKKLRKKSLRRKKRKSLLHRLLGLAGIVFILTAGIYVLTSKNSVTSKIAQEKDSLQLEEYIPGESATNPSPTPIATAPPLASSPRPRQTVACNHDNGLPAQVNDGKALSSPTCYCPAFLFECKEKKCVRFFIDGQESPGGCDWGPKVQDGKRLMDMYCEHERLAPTDGIFCVGKPVIYLYPKVPTLVNVRVETDGEIFVSDPPYTEDGWKSVLARPDGKLVYEGKTYRELFYESNVKDIRKPSRGLTIDSRNIRVELDKIISRLGLINEEKTEFLDYWVPRLENLGSRYIFFGVIERDEKERIDKVLIEPKPDTFIEFIVYFAPLNEPYMGDKLELPSSPPVRVGFTAVEWGGTIGK